MIYDHKEIGKDTCQYLNWTLHLLCTYIAIEKVALQNLSSDADAALAGNMW
jgi:hypothetical protein